MSGLTIVELERRQRLEERRIIWALVFFTAGTAVCAGLVWAGVLR